MNLNKYILLSLAIVCMGIPMRGSAQRITVVAPPAKTSLRGISIAGNTVWVSGSHGTVGRSTGKGAAWQWITVAGFEKKDFRDIQAFDSSTAIVMAIGSPAYILKTTDAGQSWQTVYYNADTAMFLDAMYFKNAQQGAVIGDPVKQHFFVATTHNQGNSWLQDTTYPLPIPNPGEAFFAASGSNLVLTPQEYYIVSGGLCSRLFTRKGAYPLPIMQGRESTGANAIAVLQNKIVIAGGDFAKPERSDSTLLYSNNGGKTWHMPVINPTGYRSSVCFITPQTIIACGIKGVDISRNGGKKWTNLSTEGYNTCAYSQAAQAVYLVGNNGKVGKLNIASHLPPNTL